MVDDLEGRFWYNNQKPYLYVIADKLPNISADDYNLVRIHKTKSLDDIIAELKHNPVDAVYTDITDLDLFKAVIAMGAVVYFPEQIYGIKSWPVKKWGKTYQTIGGVKKNKTRQKLRRAEDVMGALAGCIPLVIAYPFVAHAIKKEDNGPVIYKQERSGYNGRKFEMYKFRSMRTDADDVKNQLSDENEMDGHMFKMEDDPRITKTGKLLRKTSIDELPQFINVLKGDMSLVGTRPPTMDEIETYKARHKIRLTAKSGITGAWQTHGRNNITDFEEVVDIDKNYILADSPKESANIIMRTVLSVFHKDGK